MIYYQILLGESGYQKLQNSLIVDFELYNQIKVNTRIVDSENSFDSAPPDYRMVVDIGDMLYGFCGCFFNKNIESKIVIGVGIDWISVKEQSGQVYVGQRGADDCWPSIKDVEIWKIEERFNG